MNTSSDPRRCPACSAEIPAEAPQGLCPKCLLLGVASAAEPSANLGSSAAQGASSQGIVSGNANSPQRGRAGAGVNDNRPAPPSIDELNASKSN